MTPERKLESYKSAWERQINAVIGYRPQAQRIIELAELNGLFDPLKKIYAEQERMFPDAGLGRPVRKFSETFSAVAVLKKMFPLSR